MPRRTLALLAALGCAAPLAAAEPAVRLFAEAEDFRVEKGPWKVVPYRENYNVSSFAITFLSRMACLGAPEQPGEEAVASQPITLPRDGTFHVLARYEQPFNWSAEFTVALEQGGQEVFRHTFGKLTDPKVWAFNQHRRVPMERFAWGGTDNIVWQQAGPVKLAKGPATLRLIAGPQLENGKPRPLAARRHVDVICLTDDTAGMEAQKKTNYLEFDGWLVQDGDLFVRFTNPKDAAGPVVPVVAPFDQGQHSPYWVHTRDWPTTRVLKSGLLTDPKPYRIAGPRSEQVPLDMLNLDPAKYRTIPDAEYLQPGDTSGWVPLGQAVDALNNSNWFPTALGKGGTPLKDVYLRLEFATSDGAGGLKPVKDVTVRGPALGVSPAAFELPGVVNPNLELARVLKERYWLPVIRTEREALQHVLSAVEAMPKAGRTPQRMLFYNILGGAAGSLDAFPEARRLAAALGDNTTFGAEGKKRQLVAHWPDPTIPAIEKQAAAHKGGLADVRIVSYGDEIHLPAMPVTDAEFAAWLKDRGVRYDGPVKVTKERADPLYYYSQLCMKEKGAKHYAAGTAYYKSKGVLTGANYSPHANYLIDELDYVRPFKTRAMSMPWAEDYVWGIPEFSVQVTGYLTSGLRAGARYDDLPIHMYVMPHSPGNTPRDFRLSFYTTIGHGTKIVNYFCAVPSAVAYTENYVDTNDLPMWRELARCTHDAGVFEDYVLDAKVRPARVGLLLSSVDDVMTGASNFSLAVHNNERKAVYYALRHAQVPVDFLTEDDLIDGRAKDYAVIYVTQQWLHSRALDALKAWAEAGGMVVALAGGGFRDEFNKPNPKANDFYGVKDQKLATDPDLVPRYLLKENQPFLSKQDLPPYRPIDTASWGKLKVPVIVWKQSLAPADGQVIATFADGSPAGVEKAHGKGRAVLLGFLPGQAYLKSGLPLRPADRGGVDEAFSHFLPTAMDPAIRKAMVDAFLPAGFVRPAACSEPLVEAMVLDTPARDGKPARLAVSLANFSGKPVPSLTVKLPGLPAAKSVRSVVRGELKPATDGGSVAVTLPLEVADMLLIDR